VNHVPSYLQTLQISKGLTLLSPDGEFEEEYVPHQLLSYHIGYGLVATGRGTHEQL